MRPARVLTIDIGASHVACGVFVAGAAGRLTLQHFARESHSSESSPDGPWFVHVAKSLGAIAARRRFGGTGALAVPGHLALMKSVRTPSVATEKRDNMVAFEAAENIPYPIEEVVWDYDVVADDGVDLEVMLVAAKLDAMEALCTAAQSARVSVGHAIPAGLALCHAFRQGHPDRREPALVAGIGARSTHLAFLEGERVHVRTLPLAGNTVTQAVADELGIDFASAEALKVQVLSGRSDLPVTAPSHAAVLRAAAGFAGRLQIEITRTILNRRRQPNAEPPAALFLTGGGSLIPDLAAVLAERLRMRVERFDPLRLVDLSAEARATGAEAAAPQLAELVGLAARLTNGDRWEANLLPPAVIDAIVFRRRQPWFVAAAALVALALLPPIAYFHRRAETAEAAIARIDVALGPLHLLEARNAANLRLIDDAQQRVASLHAACSARTNWIALFSDLQGRLAKVEDVWLDTLRVVRPAEGQESSQESGDAMAGRPLRLALSGRLLDVVNPQSKVSPQSVARVKRLLASFKGSQFVAAVENEHFDNTRNGLLRFDFTLVLDPAKPL